MSHKYNLHASHHSDGPPPQLAFDLPILNRDVIGVVENQNRRFKAEPVFSLVRTVLSLIPRELQSAGLCRGNFV